MTECSWPARFLIAGVRIYQRFLSPIFNAWGPRCRFHPTCSAYALETLQKQGALRGSWRALGRLLRCHPLHPGGFDPP